VALIFTHAFSGLLCVDTTFDSSLSGIVAKGWASRLFNFCSVALLPWLGFPGLVSVSVPHHASRIGPAVALMGPEFGLSVWLRFPCPRARSFWSPCPSFAPRQDLPFLPGPNLANWLM
jgi:hypothetical protein